MATSDYSRTEEAMLEMQKGALLMRLSAVTIASGRYGADSYPRMVLSVSEATKLISLISFLMSARPPTCRKQASVSVSHVLALLKGNFGRLVASRSWSTPCFLQSRPWNRAAKKINFVESLLRHQEVLKSMVAKAKRLFQPLV